MSIAAQTAALSYYLMQPQPYNNLPYLLGAFLLAKSQLIYSTIRATGGYKFEYFSKLLITQISASLIIGVLVYSLFGKINQCKGHEEYEQIMDQYDVSTLDDTFLIKRGYDRFLSEFKTKDLTIVRGETINKLTMDETKWDRSDGQSLLVNMGKRTKGQRISLILYAINHKIHHLMDQLS